MAADWSWPRDGVADHELVAELESSELADDPVVAVVDESLVAVEDPPSRPAAARAAMLAPRPANSVTLSTPATTRDRAAACFRLRLGAVVVPMLPPCPCGFVSRLREEAWATVRASWELPGTALWEPAAHSGRRAGQGEDGGRTEGTSGASGSRTLKVAPRPRLLSTSALPPWTAASAATIASPRPLPPSCERAGSAR